MGVQSHAAPLLAQRIHGRGAVQDALTALVASEQGGPLALVGEAGIGKSRMAAWTGERAREARQVVVEGRALLGLAEPLVVFRDLVRAAGREGLTPRSRDPLAAGFPAQLLPELGASAVEAGNLGATFEAAARYLRELAGSRGSLVVLEDLHWADATSLSLVPFVARALRGSPVALLVTFRPEVNAAAAALAAMRAELRRDRLLEELALEPLAPEAAAAMLSEVLGREPAPEVRAELLRLAGGNPFALEELARAAVESGWLDPATGRRRGTGAVELPWTLADSIRARAARLAPEEREMLAWAAAIGERFDLRLLVRASGASRDEVLRAMAGLAGAGMIVEPPDDASGQRLAFRHALVHEALGQEGLAALRQGRHARILAAAEAMVADGEIAVAAAELARQAIAAGDRARALRHSRAAAAGAEELGAVEEAVDHLDRALSLWSEADGLELRAELLMACGRMRTPCGARRAHGPSSCWSWPVTRTRSSASRRRPRSAALSSPTAGWFVDGRRRSTSGRRRSRSCGAPATRGGCAPRSRRRPGRWRPSSSPAPPCALPRGGSRSSRTRRRPRRPATGSACWRRSG